jgi:Flp pilus assembly protein TadD
LTRLNKFKEAEKAFEKARRLEPHNADYLSELGFCYLALGFPTRAKRSFEKALSISPHSGNKPRNYYCIASYSSHSKDDKSGHL